MSKAVIKANIKMDSDRSFTVKVMPEEDKKWLMVLKNELSGKETELPACKSEEEVVGGFGQTLAKLSMQIVWGHADTWEIGIDFCSGEKLFYGQTEGAQVINNEGIRKIREKMTGDNIKDSVDNIIEVAKYFIHELNNGNISCQ
ncbi:hypothetical protein [Candidatus Oleimmundimicrobium sp.]|uniref:hypothetical protein n=1 Tax=Candidatus Oleimmundimicrobium sp. TaxID=3060597 RepID=UPI0027254FC8|nr:hypothetical protein [Candidatus Oleimmundimicrobium sp.]MDO8886857.1 hypothetical protein [Candidatus Oleimmundimicrobium sp.]